MSKPDPIYLDLDGVHLATTLSVSTIEKLVRDGEFPKPRLLSDRRVGWLKREVVEWCEARPVSQLLPPPNTGKRRKATRSPEPQGAPTAA